ncbi:LXG domain-containing protein [Cytobacillus firmus]|uniref:LXG domain-containing protein n=1 Tax=Cytobacillus firmus TaxID=1399 RepID=UPI00218B154D|nr:LXG domain-containing protein [Cytobacillus firmus]URM32858.1 LXG domain-containing protein [Cytobacillus firmus]
MENSSEGLSEVPLFQLSNGRRRFILKVLDARELHSGLKELHSSLDSLEEQIRNIARDVEGITSLEDSFCGEGAAAIQAFFQECHSPFLLFFLGFLADYQNTLKRILSSLQMLEPASNGFIRQSFLDGEAAQGLVKTESITTSLTEETNAVMQKVSDIVSLPHLQDGEFSAHVRRAELHRRNTVDDLMTFDSQQTLALDPIEQDLHLMQTYIDEISSLFQSGNLSISGYSVRQLQSSPIYGELLEGIRHKAGNSMLSPEFFKELGVTALGQILPPGAYSIWAIWQSNYERKTIHYQLRALKALAELNSNEISPEEFASLSGQEILTVDVIDEYGIGSENQGGNFYLYEDGRIVREFDSEKGTAYEFVDSIPEDRVGGVRELDSMADGTPLEILEYLSLAAVVRKQGTEVIRKSIKKADFDALVRILKEEKGNVVLPGRKAGKGTGKTRPSWRQSENDVGKEYPGYRDQVSFKEGNEVSHGTKNSSRPDFYINGHSIEVKNYKVTTSSGRSNLIRNVSKQINKRISDLPEQTRQSVIIDVRGQIITRDILRDIKQKINERTNDAADIIFKMDQR